MAKLHSVIRFLGNVLPRNLDLFFNHCFSSWTWMGTFPLNNVNLHLETKAKKLFTFEVTKIYIEWCCLGGKSLRCNLFFSFKSFLLHAKKKWAQSQEKKKRQYLLGSWKKIVKTSTTKCKRYLCFLANLMAEVLMKFTAIPRWLCACGICGVSKETCLFRHWVWPLVFSGAFRSWNSPS